MSMTAKRARCVQRGQNRNVANNGAMPLDLDAFKTKVTESRDLLLRMASPHRQEAYDFWQQVTEQLTAFMVEDNPSTPYRVLDDQSKSPRQSRRWMRELHTASATFSVTSTGASDQSDTTAGDDVVAETTWDGEAGLTSPEANVAEEMKLHQNTVGGVLCRDLLSSNSKVAARKHDGTGAESFKKTKTASSKFGMEHEQEIPGKLQSPCPSETILTPTRKSARISIRKKLLKTNGVKKEKISSTEKRQRKGKAIENRDSTKRHSKVISNHEKDSTDGQLKAKAVHRTEGSGELNCSSRNLRKTRRKMNNLGKKLQTEDLQVDNIGDLQGNEARDLQDDTTDDLQGGRVQSLADVTKLKVEEGEEVDVVEENEGRPRRGHPDGDQADLPLKTSTGHWRMHAGKKPFTCERCSKSFKCQARLARHARTHRDVLHHPCPHCGKEYIELQQLDAHISNSHSDKLRDTCEETKFPCDQCEKVLKNDANRKLHVRLCHKGERKFRCTECSKAFQTRSNLKRHLASHKGIKPWKCDTCNAQFGEKGTLDRHMRIHTGEKPYKCDKCEKRFATPWSLNLHTKGHTGYKGYLCDMCGQTFNNRSNLLSHHKIHLNIRPHACKLCPRKFYNKSDLERHMRSHTGEKPYLCQVCRKAFSRAEYLREHLHTHAGLTLHQCVSCGKGFVDRSNYHKHLKRCPRKKLLVTVKTSEESPPQTATSPVALPPPTLPPPPPPDVTASYNDVLGHVIHVKLEGLTNGITDEISEDQVCALIGKDEPADPVVAEAHCACIDDGCMETVESSFGEVYTVQLGPEPGISNEDLEEVKLNQWCGGYDQHVTVSSEPVTTETLSQEPLNQ